MSITNSVLLQGDCLETLRDIPNDSIDSLITDPPAGISFMGKSWDDDKGGRKQWIKWMTEIMTECLRVLKPGAHGLVWALPRTSHWTATALEDAGFEVRDIVTHLFGSGFPKSLDISKAIDKTAGAERELLGIKKHSGSNTQGVREAYDHGGYKITAPATPEAKEWQGWGTALKPASEHWILVRKPCSEKTVAANVLKHGVGGINIDASRVGLGADEKNPSIARYKSTPQKGNNGWEHANRGANFNPDSAAMGRFPANLVLTEGEATEMLDAQASQEVSRFFYCAKISKSERGEGNNHPTVKPKKLMTYLIRMITPPGGVVLDPFMGSGSTGLAAKEAGFSFLGVEKEPDYFKIAEQRLA